MQTVWDAARQAAQALRPCSARRDGGFPPILWRIVRPEAFVLRRLPCGRISILRVYIMIMFGNVRRNFWHAVVALCINML